MVTMPKEQYQNNNNIIAYYWYCQKNKPINSFHTKWHKSFLFSAVQNLFGHTEQKLKLLKCSLWWFYVWAFFNRVPIEPTTRPSTLFTFIDPARDFPVYYCVSVDKPYQNVMKNSGHHLQHTHTNSINQKLSEREKKKWLYIYVKLAVPHNF